jgi:probable DNA repair protein
VRPAVNPLLGWHLQREAAMPGADLDADRAYARRVTERIAASAPAVVFSYGAHNPELPERAQRPSPLLAGFALHAFEPGEADAAPLPADLEAVADEMHIPLANPGADRIVRGGAGVLKAQAACAFRAFAEFRLGSTALETIGTGFDAAERGSLVHNTMERFWSTVESQANLRAMSPEARAAALDRAIGEAIETALRRTRIAPTSRWDVAYIDTQRERLRRLLLPWLDIELDRALPFEVLRRETLVPQASIGPLHLTLRIDRIDATEAGDVLIDYKTGAADPKAWLSDRPDEPQLPLYAVLAPPGPLAAVAYARLRAGREMSLVGYAEPAGIVPKPAPLQAESLEQQVADWRAILTRLAEEFAAGDARVRPKSYPETCQYCAQRLLCRVNPEMLEAGLAPEEEPQEELDA